MRDLDRRLRLAVLGHKRQAVTALRDANEIDDIVLRELQAAMDVEEVRLLGPVTARLRPPGAACDKAPPLKSLTGNWERHALGGSRGADADGR